MRAACFSRNLSAQPIRRPEKAGARLDQETRPGGWQDRSSSERFGPSDPTSRLVQLPGRNPRSFPARAHRTQTSPRLLAHRRYRNRQRTWFPRGSLRFCRRTRKDRGLLRTTEIYPCLRSGAELESNFLVGGEWPMRQSALAGPGPLESVFLRRRRRRGARSASTSATGSACASRWRSFQPS